MKKIWDAQNGQALYAIDEEALHKRVLNKKDKAAKIANLAEWILIGSLLFSTGIIMTAAIYKSKFEWAPMLMAAMMVTVAIVIYVRRIKRLSWQNTFDNNILGDIEQAVANANSQVQLSKAMRWIYIAVAVLSVLGVVDNISQWWIGALVALFFGLVYMAARWEHRTFYVSQKKGLEEMRDKLANWQESDTDTTEYDGLI